MAARTKEVVLGLLPLLLPYLALFGFGLMLTAVQGLGLFTPLGSDGPTLEYYRIVLHDQSLRQSFGFTLYVALVSATGSVLAGTLLALGLWRMPPALRPIGLIAKIGLILPHVAVAFVVALVFSRTGILSALAYHLGLIGSADQFPQLLHQGNGLGMILAYMLKGAPFALLLTSAALFGFDPRLVQTAHMLGAGRWQTFVQVILPRLLPAMHSAFIILFLYALGAFDIPFVLGESRPGMLPIRVYDIFFQQDLADRPLAMAILTIMFLISALFAALYLRLAAHLETGGRKL